MLLSTGAGFHLGLLVTSFAFGFRHGIDWDHIAALTDITAAQETPRRSMRLATFYAVGHALVVLALGLAAILLSSELPDGVDVAMEHVVGATLVVFGVYVLVSLVRRGRDFRMRSRWMVVIGAIRRLWHRSEPVVIEHDHEHEAAEAHHHTHVHTEVPVPAVPSGARGSEAATHHRHPHRHVVPAPDDPFGPTSGAAVLAVGMLHGVGAETPTQVLIFASAAGVGDRAAGVVVLCAFLVGLLASNTVVAVMGAYGFVHATKRWALYATVSTLTAVFSLVVGTLLLVGEGSTLPTIFSG